jgi:hypothetical protein
MDIPDEVLRSVEATAAARGEPLRDFVIRALEAHVRSEGVSEGRSGWRSVFGRAKAQDVESVDRIVSAELEKIDLAEWR